MRDKCNEERLHFVRNPQALYTTYHMFAIYKCHFRSLGIRMTDTLEIESVIFF